MIKEGEKVLINGKQYTIDYDLKHFTIAQFVDFQEYNKAKNLAGIVSTIMFPKGEKYADTDCVEEIRQYLPFTICQTLLFFCVKESQDSINNLLTSYSPLIQKKKMTLFRRLKAMFG